ncbi:hypothetical protein ACWEV3_00840 [Saccharopolyspora sp. NPDC003752]
MTVSGKLGAALVARQWWCQAGEPILWAVWQVGETYRVAGCDENGFPKKTTGSRFARAAGRAVASAGDAAVTGLLTAAFGGTDDRGPRSTKRSPDLTVVGSMPDCSAMRLIRSESPERGGTYRQLWVLTPTRLGVLVPVVEPKDEGASDGIRQLSRGWGDVGRALVGRAPEEFGKNKPGEPLRGEEVLAWFELSRSDVAGCRLAGDTRYPGQVRHCALLLPDGSGFVLNANSALGARAMVDATNGGNRG